MLLAVAREGKVRQMKRFEKTRKGKQKKMPLKEKALKYSLMIKNSNSKIDGVVVKRIRCELPV